MGADALFLRTPEYIFSNYFEDMDKLKAYLSICLIYKRYDLISLTLKIFDIEKSHNFIKFSQISSILRRRLNITDRISKIFKKIKKKYAKNC